MSRTTLHRLQVDADLARFIDTEVLPGTGVGAEAFWAGSPTSLRPRTARCWPSATACSRSWMPGTRLTPARSPTCRPTAHF